jgi:hypothetical protein
LYPKCLSCKNNSKWCSICDPINKILTSKFLFLFFSNPIYKTKLGITNRWETINSKLLYLIIMVGQSKIGINSYILFITFIILVKSYSLCFTMPFMKFNILWKKCWAKTILLSQSDMFSFFPSIFILLWHILSTIGVVLIMHMLSKMCWNLKTSSNLDWHVIVTSQAR